ncbi:MAG: ATP-binding protein [Cyclobacteriaceae bacterium]
MLNSRGLALLLALFISLITTAFISMVPTISNTALFIAFLLSFSSSYIFIRLALEFVFFRQIDKIYEDLSLIKDPKLASIKHKTEQKSFNPLKRINKEIKNYVEEKQLEIQELKRMETFRREFIADVSHELKTPIFAAQGFVHTLLDGAVEDKKVRSKFLKKAAKSLDGLDILVQDLLTISQMETGEIKMHFEDFDIVRMCKEVMDQLEGKAEKNKIALSIKYPSDKIYVIGDYRRIYQVITNLLSNAIKYTKKDGAAIIQILVENDKVITSIADNGRGIPKEDLSRIFGRFYRVDKSRSKEKGGTGLGLAIVKHIMEGHDSKVEVESELKKGSTFSFALKKGEFKPTRILDDEDDEDDYA